MCGLHVCGLPVCGFPVLVSLYVVSLCVGISDCSTQRSCVNVAAAATTADRDVQVVRLHRCGVCDSKPGAARDSYFLGYGVFPVFEGAKSLARTA